MVDGRSRVAGEHHAPGAQPGSPIGDQRYLLLMRDQQHGAAVRLQAADDPDDVVDREHVDASRRLLPSRSVNLRRSPDCTVMALMTASRPIVGAGQTTMSMVSAVAVPCPRRHVALYES
jgi:hypothetical protein